MHIYKPQKTGKTHIILPLAFIFLALFCIALSYAEAVFRPVFLQIIGFLALGAAIFIITRYSLCDFVYKLDLEEGLLSIIRVQGKCTLTLAQFRTDTLTEVVCVKKGEKKKQKGGAVDFCENIFPDLSYLLTFDNGVEKTVVRIEVDREFTELLKPEE